MTAAPNSLFRKVATVIGAMIIVTGAIAAFTGEFDRAGVWILAVGLAALGVVGLVSVLTAAVTAD